MDEMIRKTFEIGESKAIDPEHGIYEAWISTESIDRDGDIMVAAGADIENYMKNPVVLFGHNYRDANAVVGKALGIKVEKGQGIKARWQFAPPETNWNAQTVHRLWAAGFLNATSVGFIPKKSEPRETNDDGQPVDYGKRYKEWELLEFSIVPVPANQDALRLAIKALEYADMTMTSEGLVEIKTVVPYRDTGTTEEGAWRGPTLGSFTSESWPDLSASERRRIANHFAWSANWPPEKFGDLKLPHHVARTEGIGPAHRRGVTAAMGALLGARGGVDIPDGDKRRVYNHLSKHYKQFDMEPPDFREYIDEELKELFIMLYEARSEADPDIDDDDELTDAELEELAELFSETTEELREVLK